MRAVKVPRHEGGSIGPRTESCTNWDGPISMVPCLHEGIIYTKRKLRVWRNQKCIPIVGAITPLTCAGCQNTRSLGRHYRAQNRKLHKLGRTYLHGTVFALRKYLYQMRTEGMEKPEINFASRCNNPIYLYGPSKYSVSREAV